MKIGCQARPSTVTLCTPTCDWQCVTCILQQRPQTYHGFLHLVGFQIVCLQITSKVVTQVIPGKMSSTCSAVSIKYLHAQGFIMQSLACGSLLPASVCFKFCTQQLCKKLSPLVTYPIEAVCIRCLSSKLLVEVISKVWHSYSCVFHMAPSALVRRHAMTNLTLSNGNELVLRGEEDCLYGRASSHLAVSVSWQHGSNPKKHTTNAIPPRSRTLQQMP